MNPDREPHLAAERKILSVAQLNQRARQLLETHFSRIWVEGEISNLVRPSSGHWYFTLKDADLYAFQFEFPSLGAMDPGQSG